MAFSNCMRTLRFRVAVVPQIVQISTHTGGLVDWKYGAAKTRSRARYNAIRQSNFDGPSSCNPRGRKGPVQLYTLSSSAWLLLVTAILSDLLIGAPHASTCKSGGLLSMETQKNARGGDLRGAVMGYSALSERVSAGSRRVSASRVRQPDRPRAGFMVFISRLYPNLVRSEPKIQPGGTPRQYMVVGSQRSHPLPGSRHPRQFCAEPPDH